MLVSAAVHTNSGSVEFSWTEPHFDICIGYAFQLYHTDSPISPTLSLSLSYVYVIDIAANRIQLSIIRVAATCLSF